MVHSHGAQRIMEATVDTFYTAREDGCARRFMDNTSALAMGIEVGLRSKQVLTCGRGFGAGPSPRTENTCKGRKSGGKAR